MSAPKPCKHCLNCHGWLIGCFRFSGQEPIPGIATLTDYSQKLPWSRIQQAELYGRTVLYTAGVRQTRLP